jgi:ABC-type Mn2+/Zn2+ transport system ATPase subunit
MPEGETLLRFDDVTLGYGRRPVLEHLSFSVERGEFLGLVGPNGAGKSTILRALLGLIRPLHGRLERAGQPVIGYVPQREHVDTIIPVTAGEVALMGRAPRLGPLDRLGEVDRVAARRALERAGVAHLGGELLRDLSGGQQQRVLLARALAAEPEVLVLDEPTNGMDLRSEHAVVELLRELNRGQGLTVVLVTHLLPIGLNAATSILLLEGGRSLFGPVAEVLQEERLSDLYRTRVRVAEVAGRRTLVVGGDGG